MKVLPLNNNLYKNTQFQGNQQWQNLLDTLSKPVGYGHHSVDYTDISTIKESHTLPSLDKVDFRYRDYLNLTPKEQRIVGLLNKKGMFDTDNSCGCFTRENMSINKDAERVLRMAATIKGELDKEYPNGYKLVGIGRSPAAITETMHLLGSDAIAIPFTKDLLFGEFPFSYTEYCGNGYSNPITRKFETKDWQNYFKYFGIDSNFSQRTGKPLIFTDYVCSGGTKYVLESILKGIGFSEKNIIFTEIFDLMPGKKKFLPYDRIDLGRCFDNRVFSVYGKIERLSSLLGLRKLNIIKNPEYYNSIPETFMSKLFRCAIYDLLARGK